MEKIMEDLLSTEGIRGCLVVDREGELINSLIDEKADEQLISALVAEITNEIATQMNIKVGFSITAMADKGIIFMTARRYFILVLISDSEVNTGKIRLRMRHGAKLISDML